MTIKKTLITTIMTLALTPTLASTNPHAHYKYAFAFATGYVLNNTNPSGEEVHFAGVPAGHLQQTHDRLPFMYIWNATRLIHLQSSWFDHLMLGATFSYYPATSLGIVKDEHGDSIGPYTLVATSKTLTAEFAVVFKPLGRIMPFIHANAGATRVSMSYNQGDDLSVGTHSNTNFAYKLGVGFMLPTSKHTQYFMSFTHIDNGKLETNLCDGGHCLTERMHEFEKLNLIIMGIDFLC